MKQLREAYMEGKNIMSLLRTGLTETEYINKKINHIEVAYDLQSGSYVEAMKNPEHAAKKRNVCAEMAQIVNKYCPDVKNLLKGGVGEAVTLVPFLDSYKGSLEKVYGFDISWSRLYYSKRFLKENSYDNVNVCVGTLQEIPFVSNSFDVVLTSHSLEPNGGYEKEILLELKRVSSKYVALFEPCFEKASKEGRERMTKNGYVKDLPKIAQSLGFEVVYNELLSTSVNIKNPTQALILKKKFENKNEVNFACPHSNTPLSKFENGYISKESLYYYPIVDNIPVLRKINGVLVSALSNKLA